jgi:hypothetical protein
MSRGELERMTVEWPMVLPSVANMREHWATKAKRVKAQRMATATVLAANGASWKLRHLRPKERLAVRLTRIAPRELDDDNLVSAMKAVRDSVAAYFGLDDRSVRIRFEYAQAKGKPASVRIDLAIESGIRTLVELNAAKAHEAIANINQAFGS